MASVYNVKGFFVQTLVLLASVRSANDRTSHSGFLHFSLPPPHLIVTKCLGLVIRTPRAAPWSPASFLRRVENTKKIPNKKNI